MCQIEKGSKRWAIKKKLVEYMCKENAKTKKISWNMGCDCEGLEQKRGNKKRGQVMKDYSRKWRNAKRN